jgi:hypothetical protein
MLRTMLFKSLRKLWNILIWRIIPQTAYLVSLVWRRSPMQAAFAWPDTMPTVGPRVALFVHFDSGQRVRPYVLHYLAQLVAADLSVLFVSNAGELLPEAIEQLKPFCAGILVRRNIGYDFVAMREGLVHFGLPRADTELLILANDSVYGPLRPLDEMISKFDFTQADLWGATDSWQARYHLQSYFLAAGPTLLRHPAWAKFWAQVAPVPSKRWVIAKYEVGITQWMLREGLRCAALWPYQQLLQEIDLDMVLQGVAANTPDTDPVIAMRRIQARRVRIGYVNRTAQNPTSDLWRQLLQAGFPFLKRELLRDNPTAVSDIVDWRMVVQETSSADISTIERDLQRQVRNQAP